VSIQVVHEDKTFRLATWRNLTIATWYDAPNAQQVRRIRRSNENMAARYPDGIGFMNAIMGGSPRFGAEMRAEVEALLKESRTYSVGSVHVVEVRGLKGATVRAFLSTLTLISPVPTRVFGNIDDAADWMAPRLGFPGGDRIHPEDIQDFYEQASAQLR